MPRAFPASDLARRARQMVATPLLHTAVYETLTAIGSLEQTPERQRILDRSYQGPDDQSGVALRLHETFLTPDVDVYINFRRGAEQVFPLHGHASKVAIIGLDGGDGEIVHSIYQPNPDGQLTLPNRYFSAEDGIPKYRVMEIDPEQTNYNPEPTVITMRNPGDGVYVVDSNFVAHEGIAAPFSATLAVRPTPYQAGTSAQPLPRKRPIERDEMYDLLEQVAEITKELIGRYRVVDIPDRGVFTDKPLQPTVAPDMQRHLEPA